MNEIKHLLTVYCTNAQINFEFGEINPENDPNKIQNAFSFTTEDILDMRFFQELTGFCIMYNYEFSLFSLTDSDGFVLITIEPIVKNYTV